MSGEFRVNSYQNNWQENPVVLTHADGGFTIFWDSYFDEYGDSPSVTYVAGQHFEGGGGRIGNEFVVHAINGSSSEEASVTRLKDGGYVVAYSYTDSDPILTNDENIYLRIYNADDSLRTTVRVDQLPSSGAILPSVSALGDGGFVVTWGRETRTGQVDDVSWRAFDADGSARGLETQLNPRKNDFDQIHTRSCTLSDGRVLSIWGAEGSLDTGGTFRSNDVRGTLFSADGRVLRSDFHIIGTTGSVPHPTNSGYDLAALPNGGFVMVSEEYSHEIPGSRYETGRHVLLSFGDRSGNILRTVSAYETDEVMYDARLDRLETGEIVVVWEQRGIGDIGRDIMGRVFSASGQPLTAAFEIGVDYDRYDDQTNAEIAALAGGGFVVTYQSESIDNDNEGIAARVFGRGGNGNDVLTVDITGTMNGMAGNDTITGNAAGNVLLGGTGNDRLVGLAGADRMIGGSGDDLLLGGSGNDLLVGGPGADRLDGGEGLDRVILSGIASVANLATGIARQSQTGGRVETDRMSGVEALSGTSGGDRLTGDGVANWLYGGNGNDLLFGASGNDMLRGDGGNDRLYGETGNDRLFGNLGNDLLYGASGHDQLYGDAGNDRVSGGVGNDTLGGGSGHDTIYGESGHDRMDGDSGNDRMLGAAGHDTLNGGSGHDTIDGDSGNDYFRGGSGNDLLRGGSGHDRIIGDSGHDRIYGGSDNDSMSGGSGNDYISGGTGRDLFSGGSGADVMLAGNDNDRDVFLFASIGDSRTGRSADRILQFDSGEDILDLTRIDADTGRAGDQSFRWSARAADHAVWQQTTSKGCVLLGDVNGDHRADFAIYVYDLDALTRGDVLL